MQKAFITSARFLERKSERFFAFFRKVSAFLTVIQKPNGFFENPKKPILILKLILILILILILVLVPVLIRSWIRS